MIWISLFREGGNQAVDSSICARVIRGNKFIFGNWINIYRMVGYNSIIER